MSPEYPSSTNQPDGNIQQYPYSQYPPGDQPVILPPPPMQAKQRKGPKQLWRDAGKGGKCGLIAVCLLLPLSLCICISVATAPTSNRVASNPTHTVAQASTAKPTQVPTSTPTQVPTSVPTQAPTPTPKPIPPTPVPTQRPAPTQPPATGVNGNPWGYNFTPGNLIYQPAADFCGYFTCVSTFWTKTNGYVAACNNGDYTHSGGVSGACSRDGGIKQALYSH